MLDCSVEIDQAAANRMSALLSAVAKYMPDRLGAEVKRAAIYVCKSLKPRTVNAPKRVPKSEYSAAVSTLAPKYAHSNSDHKRLLRRWALTRKLGTDAEYTKHYYVYTSRHRDKGGKMVGGSLAQEKRELLRQHGLIQHRGLAKKAWGWAAQKIYNGGAADMGDLSWKRGRHDRRDPRQDVHGTFQQGGNSAQAQIVNALDYANKSLMPGAMSQALSAASNKLAHNLKASLMRAFDKSGGGANGFDSGVFK